MNNPNQLMDVTITPGPSSGTGSPVVVSGSSGIISTTPQPQQPQQQYIYYSGCGSGALDLGMGNNTTTVIQQAGPGQGPGQIISAAGELIQYPQFLPYADNSQTTATYVGNLSGVTNTSVASTSSPMLIYPADPSTTTQIQYENLAQYIQIPEAHGTTPQTLDPNTGLIYSFNYPTAPPPEPQPLSTPITFSGPEGFEDLIQIPTSSTPAPAAPTMSMEQAPFNFTINKNNRQEIISYEDFSDLLLTLPQNSTISIDSEGRIHLPLEETPSETITIPSVSQIQPTPSLSSVVVTNPQSVIHSVSSSAPTFLQPMQAVSLSRTLIPSQTSVSSVGPSTSIPSTISHTVPGDTSVTPIIHTVPYPPPPPIGSVIHTVPSPVAQVPVTNIKIQPQPVVYPRTQFTVTTLKPPQKESPKPKPIRLYSSIPPSTTISKPTLVDDDIEILKTIQAPAPKISTPKTYLLLKKPTESNHETPKINGPSIVKNTASTSGQVPVPVGNQKPIQIQVPGNLVGGQMKGTGLQLGKTNQKQFKTVVVLRGKSPNPTTTTTNVFTLNNPRPTAIRGHSVPTHQVYARKSAPTPIQPNPNTTFQDKSAATLSTAVITSAPITDNNSSTVNGPVVSDQVHSTTEETNKMGNTVIVNGDSHNPASLPQSEEVNVNQDPKQLTPKQQILVTISSPTGKKPKMNGNVKTIKKVALSNLNQAPPQPPAPPPPPLRPSLVTWEDGIGKLTGTDLKFRVNPTTGILEVIDYVPPPIPNRTKPQDENSRPPTLIPKSKLIPSNLKVMMKKKKNAPSYLNKLDRRTKIFRYMKHNPVVGMVKTSTSVTAAAKLLHNATSGKKVGKRGRSKRRNTSATESESEKDLIQKEIKQEPSEPADITTENSNAPHSPKQEEQDKVTPKKEPQTDDESIDTIEYCESCAKFVLHKDFFNGRCCTKCGESKSVSPKKKDRQSAPVLKKSSAPIVSIDATPASTSSVTVVPIFFQSKAEDEIEKEEINDSDPAPVKKRRGVGARRKKTDISTKVEELPPLPRKSRPASKTPVIETEYLKKSARKRSFDRLLAIRKAKANKILSKKSPSPASSGRSSSIDQRNLEGEQDSSAEEEDRDSSVERKLTKKGEFNWTNYLLENNAKGAPARLFRQPAFPPQNPFKPGKMLEAIDPQHQSLICVAHVVDTQGYRLRLRLTGYPDTFDFWVNADSLEIFPAGWCETHGFTLEPPPNIENFNWHKYMIDEQCSAAERDWFSIAKEENGLSSHIGSSIASDIKIGMKLEAVDIHNQSLVCVATIAQVINDRILIHFDSWESSYDYWSDMTSPFIHPVGWCEKNGFELTPPRDFKGPFTWEKYLKETKSIPIPSQYFRPLPPISFKKGMKLECVDKRNPFLVRVATVADVEDHQLQIHFDGWPSTYDYKVYECSTDIHPVGWCQATGHPLQPPPCDSEIWNGPCSTYGCLGLGHIKGPKFLTHHGESGCPYSNANMHKDLNTILPDRLISFKKSKVVSESKKAESVTSSTTSSSGRAIREKRKLSLAALDSGCSNSSADVDILRRPKLSRKSSSSIPELFPETDLSPNDTEEAKKKTKDKKDKSSDNLEEEPEAPVLSKIETSISPIPTPPKKSRSSRKSAKLLPPDLLKIEDAKPKVEEPFLSTIQLPNIESTITASSCDSDRKHWDDIIESVVRRKSSTEERGEIQPDTPSSTFSLPPSTTMTPISAACSSSTSGSVPAAEDDKPDLLLISSGQGPFEVTTKQLAEEIKSGNTFTTVAGVTISSSPLNNPIKSGTCFDPVPSTMTTAISGHGLGLSGQSSANTTTVTTVVVPCVSPDVVKSQPNSPQLIITPSTSTGSLIVEPDLPINYTVNIKALQEIVKDTNASTVSHWTTDEVAKFVEHVPGCIYAAKQLETQKVDGEAFLMLNQIDLIEIMGFKMGPAIKLSHALRLIHRNSN